MSSLDEDQGKSSPKPSATSTTLSAGGLSTLNEILGIKVGERDDGSVAFAHKYLLRSQIKAWVAEEIIGPTSREFNGIPVEKLRKEARLNPWLATNVENRLRDKQLKRLEES